MRKGKGREKLKRGQPHLFLVGFVECLSKLWLLFRSCILLMKLYFVFLRNEVGASLFQA